MDIPTQATGRLEWATSPNSIFVDRARPRFQQMDVWPSWRSGLKNRSQATVHFFLSNVSGVPERRDVPSFYPSYQKALALAQGEPDRRSLVRRLEEFEIKRGKRRRPPLSPVSLEWLSR